MSHVVMQAAEFPSPELAERCATELRALVETYAAFERERWRMEREGTAAPGPKFPSAPLVDFGARHGVVWPADDSGRFAIKGAFDEDAEVVQVDRMVFFYIPGFHLGGDTLRDVFRRLGAIATGNEGSCALVIRDDAPDALAAQLADYLVEADYEDQFQVVAGDSPTGDASDALFRILIQGASSSAQLVFDGSGVSDWAFVNVLSELLGKNPSLVTS